MCERDSGEQRRRYGAGDSGDDLAFNPGGGQRERFLATTPEHERIAALQPHDLMATARFPNHEPIDRVLRNGRTAGALANKEPARAWGKLQRPWIDQRVIQHEIGRFEPLDRLERQKFGISRSGADQ
jgi:hypothetical protein